MLDGMLFSGPLSLKRNRDLQQWIRLRDVIRMNLVCTAVFLYMFSIEKQRSVVDTRGLDLQNDI